MKFVEFTETELVEKMAMIGIFPPEGGRIYPLFVGVSGMLPWHEAVNLASPRTPQSQTIYKVGDQYPPVKADQQSITLVNFGKNVVKDDVYEYADKYSFGSVSARACLAIAENNPKLYDELGVPSLGIVSFEACSFKEEEMICKVWIERNGCESHLGSPHILFNPIHWFAFIRVAKKQEVI